MENLLIKNGKIRKFEKIVGDFYIDSKGTFEQFHTEEYFRSNVYCKYNDTAILVGYISKKQLIDNLEHYSDFLKTSLPKYFKNFSNSLNGDIGTYGHEVYTSSLKYVQSLFDWVTEENFDEFRSKYEKFLDDRRVEKENEYLEKAKQEKELELTRLEEIGDKIKNSQKITGREMLDYINHKNVNVPIKTKGLINRCSNINLEGLTIIKGKVPKQANNVFGWYRKLQEITK